MIIARHLKRAAVALFTVGSVASVQSAFAAGTASNTTISNRATVSYSVGGVAQADIGSSPTGNSAGAGSDTTFVVDNKILHIVSEVSGAADAASPGGVNVTTFTVTNSGNTSQGYLLTPTNTALAPLYGGGADNADVSNLRVRVESGLGDPLNYDAQDTAVNIASLAADASVRIYILADVPAGTANGAYANVQLAAQATNNGTTTVVTQTGGADNPAVVDVVFAEGTAGTHNGIHEAVDQYLVSSATLSVTKTLSVVSDPFNGTSNPKAIPEAIVEYAIVVTNTGGSNATGVVVNDPLPANTTFVQGAYAGATDVSVQVGAGAAAYCVAEAAADSNADGCFRNGSGQLIVQSPTAIGTVSAGAANAVTVRFRVEIN